MEFDVPFVPVLLLEAGVEFVVLLLELDPLVVVLEVVPLTDVWLVEFAGLVVLVVELAEEELVEF